MLKHLTLTKLQQSLPEELLNELSQIRPEYLYTLQICQSPLVRICFQLPFYCRDKNYLGAILPNPNFIRYFLSQNICFPDNLAMPEIMYILSLKSTDFQQELAKGATHRFIKILNSQGQTIYRYSESNFKDYEFQLPELTELECRLSKEKIISPDQVDQFMEFLKIWPHDDVMSFGDEYKFRNSEIKSISQLFLSKI